MQLVGKPPARFFLNKIGNKHKWGTKQYEIIETKTQLGKTTRGARALRASRGPSGAEYVVFAQLRGQMWKNCSFGGWILFLVVEIRHFRKFDKYLHFWCHEGAVRMPPLALSKFLCLVHENNVQRYRNNAYFKFSECLRHISFRFPEKIRKS